MFPPPTSAPAQAGPSVAEFTINGDLEILDAQSSRLMNFDPISERIIRKKSFPRHRRTILDHQTDSLQPSLETFEVAASQTKVPLPVRSAPAFLNRHM
jgi:hypothetical protein